MTLVVKQNLRFTNNYNYIRQIAEMRENSSAERVCFATR